MLETINTPTKVENLPLHDPCEPVGLEIGDDPKLAEDTDYKEVFDGLTEVLVGQGITYNTSKRHANTELGSIIDKSESAEKVRIDLGCAGCKLSGVCLVKSALDDIVSAGESAKELEEKLKITRQGVEFVQSLTSLFRLAYEEDATALVQDTNRTDSVPKLLWGVDVTVKSPIRVSEVPEIQHITAIDTTKDLQNFDIVVNGKEYTLIDASDALDIGGIHQPTSDSAKVLIDKLFDRLKEQDEKGEPQLATADAGAQKRIVSATENDTFELRKGGKSRLYFIFKAADSDSARSRIILLGAHGDNVEQQQAFINAI